MSDLINLDMVDSRQASIFFGIFIGACFGILAHRTKFCFRSAFIVERPRQETAIWMSALITALAGTQIITFLGFISFNQHRFFQNELPWLALILGGLLFGSGMVLTRGCISRLTVLAGTGNLRAAMVLLIFGIVAHASLKGIISEPIIFIKTITLNTEKFSNSIFILIIKLTLSLTLTLFWAFLVLRTKPKLIKLLLASFIGMLIPLSWAGTGFILYDEFNPIAFESLSYTKPYADTLFWIVASSAIPANFGVGLVGGTVCGSIVTSLVAREFRIKTFESTAQTTRYFIGATMMGVGGVLAGGCTIGAGLAGFPSLAPATLLATISIILGGLACKYALASTSFLSVYAGSLDKQAQPQAK